MSMSHAQPDKGGAVVPDSSRGNLGWSQPLWFQAATLPFSLMGATRHPLILALISLALYTPENYYPSTSLFEFVLSTSKSLM